MPEAGPPAAVSVVIATRNRPAMVVRALRSVLANRKPQFEVVILDQSDDETTAAALGPLLDDPRVRYVASASAGQTRAHNLAITRTRGALVAITDDDCEVPPDWVARMVAAFRSHERTAVVFGNVLPAPHDAHGGFIPSYVRSEPLLVDRVHHRRRVAGIGACMGVRRAAWEALGGFDERLGAGAPFRAANEGDLAMRALSAGWRVYETPDVWVVHYGFRPRNEGHALVTGYAYGTGAMMAKHIRCRTPHVLGLLARMALEWGRGALHPASRIGDGRHRRLRLTAFVHGLLAGATAPLDARACRYVDERKAL